ncbi:MAG TPA: hypothetical protein P5137_01035 [Candidatus Brocadiia bacterium]|nr:hypothetical protein [Candidatus Brocadiia bacterium]
MNSSVFQELSVSFTGDTTGLAAAAAEAARLMDSVAAQAGLAPEAPAAPAEGGLADAGAAASLSPAGQDAAPGLNAAAEALLGAAQALGAAGLCLSAGAAEETSADAAAAAPLLPDADRMGLSLAPGALCAGADAAPAGPASPGAIQASVTNNITQNTTLKTDIEDPEKAALKLIAPLDRLIQERAGLGFLEAVRQVSLLLASQGAR